MKATATTLWTPRLSMLWLAAFWLPALWLTASPAVPQAEISALSQDLTPLTETNDLRCTRFASFEEEPEVTIGMPLEPGDLVESVSGGTDLELTCPGGSLLRFSGNFRVLVDAPGEGSDCAINFLSGTLDVLTDRPTEVNAGGVVLGTEGTQYTVEVLRRDGAAVQDCTVWDGKVRWRAPSIEEKWVKSGERLDLNLGRLPREAIARIEPTKITHEELERAAARYARFDMAKSQATAGPLADTAAVSKKLRKLHYQVLEKPADVDRRVELAKAQLEVKVSNQATYNLDRAGVRSETDLQRYQIDSSKLKASTTLRVPPGTIHSVRLPPSSPAPPPPSPPASSRDPFLLIEQQRHREAISILKQRLEASAATARDYCGLARAYFYSEGKGRRAEGYASRAMRRSSDDTLSGDELRLCRYLAPSE